MNIFPHDAEATPVRPEYTATQAAFIDALKADQIPLLNHYFTINQYFDLNEDGEFEHIDTHVAFKIFEAGYGAAEFNRLSFENTAEDQQFEDEVVAAVFGRDQKKALNREKLKDWAIMIGILLIGLIIGYYVNFAQLNSKIHF